VDKILAQQVPVDGEKLSRLAALRQRLNNIICNRLLVTLLTLSALFLLLLLFEISRLLDDGAQLSLPPLLLAAGGFFLSLLLLRLTQHNLLSPLTDLRGWTHRMHNGQLSARVPLPPSGQLRQLFLDINELGERIQVLSRNMEEKVQNQTRNIAEKNITLQVLYDVASSVSVTQDIQDLLSRSLNALKGVIDARAATIRLLDSNNQFRLVASSGFREQDRDYELLKTAELELCEMTYEGRTIYQTSDLIDIRHFTGTTFSGINRLGLISVPLTYHGKVLGIFNLFTDSSNWQEKPELRELLMNIGQHLGMAIQKSRLDEEARRISVIDERNRMAHELHDSLAQSLASLRFQVRVLDDTLHTGVESAIWRELERIENSLDEAYQELRDLIAHCRVRNEGDDLSQNIKLLVNRYRNETEMHFLLQIEWGELVLPSESEIQILRIIQESLRNIYKHSDANTVRILLSKTGQDSYQVLIEDDGVGFIEQPANASAGEHIGLKIMKERARRFGGHLEIESEPGEGTRIILTFSHSQPRVTHPRYTQWMQ
jgi:two-component system nitrate/nitrite sensor histidine kinase NarX